MSSLLLALYAVGFVSVLAAGCKGLLAGMREAPPIPDVPLPWWFDAWSVVRFLPLLLLYAFAWPLTVAYFHAKARRR